MNQPSEKMVLELKRLRNIVLSCDQQFADFIRYCAAECEVSEEFVLDVNTWTFMPRPQQKVADIADAKKKIEGGE